MKSGKSLLSCTNLFIRFSYSIANFLVDCTFKSVKSFLSVLELITVVLSHLSNLRFEFLSQHPKLVFELGPESFECVVDSLRLGLSEITVCLNLPLNVLEFCFELFLRLDALHQHDIVISVHFHELIVHLLERYVVVLLLAIALHVLVNQFVLGWRNKSVRRIICPFGN